MWVVRFQGKPSLRVVRGRVNQIRDASANPARRQKTAGPAFRFTAANRLSTKLGVLPVLPPSRPCLCFRITPFAIARVQGHGDRTKSGTRDRVAT